MSWFHGSFNRKRVASSVERPLASTEQLVVEEIADELLVYDQRSDLAHCLTSDAARVWRACDGRRTVEELSETLALDQQTVRRALEELGDCGLLDRGSRAGLTRREASVRLAQAGVAAASARLIYSIAAPTPALAATPACPATACYSISAGQGQTTCFTCGCGVCNGNDNNHFVCLPNSSSGVAPTQANCNTALMRRCAGVPGGPFAPSVSQAPCPAGSPCAAPNCGSPTSP